MINDVRDLIGVIADLQANGDTKIRVYLNGRYIIEKVRVSEDDGAIVLWLDERGDPQQ